MTDYPASAYQELCAAYQALKAEHDEAVAAIQRARDRHTNAGESQGYSGLSYVSLGDCCGTCGTFGEYGVPWPCPTIRALDGAP